MNPKWLTARELAALLIETADREGDLPVTIFDDDYDDCGVTDCVVLASEAMPGGPTLPRRIQINKGIILFDHLRESE